MLEASEGFWRRVVETCLTTYMCFCHKRQKDLTQPTACTQKLPNESAQRAPLGPTKTVSTPAAESCLGNKQNPNSLRCTKIKPWMVPQAPEPLWDVFLVDPRFSQFHGEVARDFSSGPWKEGPYSYGEEANCYGHQGNNVNKVFNL